MSCAWDIITHIFLHKTKTNLENVSKKPSYAFVMNIKMYPNIAQPFIVLFMLSYHGKWYVTGHQNAPYSDIDW